MVDTSKCDREGLDSRQKLLTKFEMIKVMCILKFNNCENDPTSITNTVELIHNSNTSIQLNFLDQLIGRVPIQNNLEGFHIELNF